MKGIVTLARWLGPWASPTASPRVERALTAVAGIKTAVYGRVGRGSTYLIAPGLHFAGADDPRMDRFCRILAAAGHRVIAPFVPAYLALTPDASAIEDFTRVFDEVAHAKPVVFSISFGSLLAFAVAANRPEHVDRLVIFGGYANFHDTLRFCLTGAVSSGRKATRDPLNQPVVLMNLLDHIAHDAARRDVLVERWRAYVTRTWGRPEMKARERFVAIAEELAPDVPESVRDLFMIGIGAAPGAWDLAQKALEDFDATALDPSPYLSRVRCRVDLVHGVDDDVIPFEHSQALAARLINTTAHVHVTGLYGHTGTLRPPIAALVKELATMVRVLRVLST